MRSGPGAARTILLFHIIRARPSKQPRMVCTFLKVYMELGSYVLFLQEQIKDIIIFIITQSETMLDETSALRGNMPQRNDAEGCKNPRLSFSPVSSVWGQMGSPWTTDGRNAPRTTENITEQDYVAFFHQFLGFTNNPALAPFANVQCHCQRSFMGGDSVWDHINSCIHLNANWTCAHEHVLRVLEHICHATSFDTNHKRMLLPLQQAGRQLLCGPWLSDTQRRVLSPPRCLLPTQLMHHRDDVCSGCGVAWRPHHCASPRCCVSQPAAPPHGRRRECLGR